MYQFCPEHGDRFSEIGDFRKYWARVLKCGEPRCPGYIEIADAQWEYPLLQLQAGVLSALETATPAILEDAFNRVKRIDYKTISIIFFEHTLLGCYRRRDEYKVLYRDE